MKLPVEDNNEHVEGWGPKQFMEYISLQLEVLHIPYKPQIPDDLIIVATILKWARDAGKSSVCIKERIDTFLASHQLSNVTSLAFLRPLFTVPTQVNVHTTCPVYKNTDITLSDDLLQKLQALKKEVQL